jgi:tetraacyldisaccharide 4'-kinase
MRAYLYALATDQNNSFGARIVKVILFLASVLYGLTVSILIGIYRLKPRRLGCKIISVGNITVGGTGKTPLVELVALKLAAAGHAVAIVTRGYARRGHAPQSIVDSTGVDYRRVGDEPRMLQEKLKNIPVIVDGNRIRAVHTAISKHKVDTVILDDGFQQWKIKKDLEIVTIDASNPFGNRHLIPRGIVRQPLSTLAGADVFVLTKTNLGRQSARLKEFLASVNPGAPIFETEYVPTGMRTRAGGSPEPGLELADKPVVLVSGIAQPDSFEQLVIKAGITVGAHLRFADHHAYSPRDWDTIAGKCRQIACNTIVTTEKDSVRLHSVAGDAAGLGILVFQIKLTFVRDESGFYNRLRRIYSV